MRDMKMCQGLMANNNAAANGIFLKRSDLAAARSDLNKVPAKKYTTTIVAVPKIAEGNLTAYSFNPNAHTNGIASQACIGGFQSPKDSRLTGQNRLYSSWPVWINK